MANLKQADFFSGDEYHYFRVKYFQQRAEEGVIQIHVSLWGTIGAIILQSLWQAQEKKFRWAFCESGCLHQAGLHDPGGVEKSYVLVFIKTVLSITRAQALHINNPAFQSQWRQEHGFCPAAAKERVAFH